MNTIVPSSLQVPPRSSGASQSVDRRAAGNGDLLELAFRRRSRASASRARRTDLTRAFRPRQRGGLQGDRAAARRGCHGSVGCFARRERQPVGRPERGPVGATRACTSESVGAQLDAQPQRRWRHHSLPPGRPEGEGQRESQRSGQRRPGRGASPERQARAAAGRRRFLRRSAERLVERHARVGDVVLAVLRVALQAVAQQATDRRRRRGRQLVPLRLAREHRGEHVGDRLAVEEPLARQHLEQHARRRPRRRRACRRACRAPARATCRRPCRGSSPPRCPCARGWGTATSRSCRWRLRHRCSRPWRGRSRGP